MDPNEELLGADLMEHHINHTSVTISNWVTLRPSWLLCSFQIGISRALSALAPIKLDLKEMMSVPKIGRNPGHDNCIEEIRKVRRAMKRKYKFDFVCFLRLKTEITMTGPLTIKAPQKSPLERVKCVKRLSRSGVVSYRNAKVHAQFRTIIMHLKRNDRQFNLDYD